MLSSLRRWWGASPFVLAAFAGCTPKTRPPGPPPLASAPPVVASAQAIAPLPPPPAPKVDPKLPTRDALFAVPTRLSPSLSPDGKRVAFVKHENHAFDIWVAPADAIERAKQLTHEPRGVHEMDWSYGSDAILYAREAGEPDDTHVMLLDVTSGSAIDLTPVDGVAAHVLRLSSRFPNEALLVTNERDRSVFDVVRADLSTHERKLVMKNDAGLATVLATDDFQVRVGRRELANGGAELLLRVNDEWQPLAPILPEDAFTTHALWLDKAGTTLFLEDSRGRDNGALVAMDLASKRTTVLAESPRADLSSPLASPIDHKVQAIGEMYAHLEWKLLDESLKPDFAYLRTVADGELQITSRTDDDKRWIAQITPKNGPPRFYLYDRPTKHATLLFSIDEAQDALPLSRSNEALVKARDGATLVSYLTLPRGADHDTPGKPTAPLPMVLLVHNGGWARDVGTFDPYAEWLATRGYAVLQVNFRGSAGFGKAFVNAGDREWGGKMQDDLLDAVAWAVNEKIADPAKVAIFGGSFGGYAALEAMATSPKTFACGVDISGPVNLATFVSSIPRELSPLLESAAKHIGDPRTEEGRKLLAERSPLTHVSQIEKPLLIAQGEHDPRAPRSEIDGFVQTLVDRRVPVTYAVFGDEGHGLTRPENAKTFSAIAETFLAQCLGGTYEPMGDDFGGSSVHVLAGVDRIYGLSELLPR